MHKVLINGLQLSGTNTGVQYYTKNLFNGLVNINFNKLDYHLLRSPVLGLTAASNNRVRRILFENFFLPNYLKKNNVVLYHSPNYVLPFLCNFPSVLTIHDLITLDYPDLCQRESVVYFRLLLARSIKKATKIITVSHTVKNDILRHFNVPEKKIKVIWHGINPIFKKTQDKEVLKKYHLPDKYILFVGNIEPKKNLERLIRSFALLKENTKITHKLVIAGKKGWKYKTVYKTITKLKIEKEIIFTGYVPEKDLPAIYSMADLFVFPSIYEGFGIPPLEAMACGTPVLVSNRGALPETTGGNCLMVNPYDIENIANGMYRLLNNKKLREGFIKKGKGWARQFTWEKAAKKTMEVYHEMILQRNESSTPLHCNTEDEE